MGNVVRQIVLQWTTLLLKQMEYAQQTLYSEK
jgi:hypothetical protein